MNCENSQLSPKVEVLLGLIPRLPRLCPCVMDCTVGTVSDMTLCPGILHEEIEEGHHGQGVERVKI